MAKIQKKDGSLVIRKSFWSAISIWWALVFLIAIPAGCIIVGLSGVNSMLGMNFEAEQECLINLIAMTVGAASFVITFLSLFVMFVCVKKTTWTFYDGAVIYKKGRVFYTEENTRDMEFFPGMSVSVRRSIKGKFFNYGEVIISNGAGEAGEIVMAGAKPKTAIGKNTKHCMQSGIIFGFAGLVGNILFKIKKELGVSELNVIATGGMGEIIAKEVKDIKKVDRTLTLDGLNTIYKLNNPDK